MQGCRAAERDVAERAWEAGGMGQSRMAGRGGAGQGGDRQGRAGKIDGRLV